MISPVLSAARYTLSTHTLIDSSLEMILPSLSSVYCRAIAAGMGEGCSALPGRVT